MTVENWTNARADIETLTTQAAEASGPQETGNRKPAL